MLVRGGDGRSDSSEAHGDTAPARNGGEFGGALHGFADIAEMIGSASVDKDGLALRRAERTRDGHRRKLAQRSEIVKYFALQSKEWADHALRG